jgi:hypothetical protein
MVEILPYGGEDGINCCKCALDPEKGCSSFAGPDTPGFCRQPETIEGIKVNQIVVVTKRFYPSSRSLKDAGVFGVYTPEGYHEIPSEIGDLEPLVNFLQSRQERSSEGQ